MTRLERLRLSYTADCRPGALNAVAVVDDTGARTIEVQVVRVDTTVGSRGPVVAVRPANDERTEVVGAGVNAVPRTCY